MAANTTALWSALTALAPITMITYGVNAHDKTQWQVTFDPSATDAQKTAVQQAINSFDSTVFDVPQTVTAAQARVALQQQGLLDQVNNFINTQSQQTQLYWEYSPEVNRYHPLIVSLGPELNMTSTQLDQLFTLARTL